MNAARATKKGITDVNKFAAELRTKGGKGSKQAQEKEKSNVRTMVNLTPSLFELVRQEVRDRQDDGDRKATISGVIREAVAGMLGGK